MGRVSVLVERVARYLPRARLEEVYDLVEHGEPAEGLCSLAWAIVAEEVQVPASIIAEIREYVAGLVDDEHMPADLDCYAVSHAESDGSEQR